jgi:hypothetical protein
VTRVRIPPGLPVAEGVYEHTDPRIDAIEWDQLSDTAGVEIECDRHIGQWWPTTGTTISGRDLPSWRCPTCAWSFRDQLAGRGGTPQF